MNSVRRVPLTQRNAAVLKGRDAAIATAALEAGVSTTLVHCLVAAEGGDVLESWALPRYPTAADIARWNRQVGSRRDAELPSFDIDDHDDHDGIEAHFIGPLDAFRRLFEGVYSSTGFYGNEASDAEYYVTAVLELTFERYRAPGGGGRRIVHPKFGPGVVVNRLSDGTSKATVRFDDGSERTLLEAFLKDAE